MATGTPHPPARVLHVITHLALGGAERIALTMAGGMQPDFAPALFAVHGRGGDEVGEAMWREAEAAQIPVFTGTPRPLKRGGVFAAARRIRAAMTSFAPDIVHVHTEIPEFALAAGLAAGGPASRRAIVRTIHNSQYWHHWAAVGRWTDRKLARAWIAGVSSGALKAFAALRARSGAPPPPAAPRIIFNGIAPPAAGPADSHQRAQPATFRLLYAGRFDPQKGTDLLPGIAAATRLPPGATAELVVHGSGEHAALLRDFAARPPRGWSVRVAPPVAGLAAQLSSFDLVLMPSRFEGLSLVAIEAMLAGVPLVATDAPGLREQLPPEHAWRAAAADAPSFADVLTRALHDPGARARSAASARDFARKSFSLDAMLAGYRGLYRQILDTRPDPR